MSGGIGLRRAVVLTFIHPDLKFLRNDRRKILKVGRRRDRVVRGATDGVLMAVQGSAAVNWLIFSNLLRSPMSIQSWKTTAKGSKLAEEVQWFPAFWNSERWKVQCFLPHLMRSRRVWFRVLVLYQYRVYFSTVVSGSRWYVVWTGSSQQTGHDDIAFSEVQDTHNQR